FSTAFLSSNQAKTTCLPLAVFAVSTPRQPGLAFRAATRSGNPLLGSGLPGGWSPAVCGASSPTQTMVPSRLAESTQVLIRSSKSVRELPEYGGGELGGSPRPRLARLPARRSPVKGCAGPLQQGKAAWASTREGNAPATIAAVVLDLAA